MPLAVRGRLPDDPKRYGVVLCSYDDFGGRPLAQALAGDTLDQLGTRGAVVVACAGSTGHWRPLQKKTR